MTSDGVFWFEDLGREHGDLAGKKAANLGEMTRLGLPVPPGFAISIAVYRSFAEQTGVAREIAGYFSGLGEMRGRSVEVFDTAASQVRSMIESKAMPDAIRTVIASYYDELCRRTGTPDVAVAVRSSGKESRPGMFDTYLNVAGIEEVLDKVKKVWASAYSARAIAFRADRDIPATGEELGIAVLKMIDARSSGIAFTADPVSGADSRITIEAGWGLGDAIVGGDVNNDRFVVDKTSLAVVDSAIGAKARRVVMKARGVGWEDVPAATRDRPCLSPDEVAAIARLAMVLEERLGAPQDVEWAVEAGHPSGGGLFLIQTRPVKLAAAAPASVADRMVDLIARTFYKPV